MNESFKEVYEAVCYGLGQGVIVGLGVYLAGLFAERLIIVHQIYKVGKEKILADAEKEEVEG